MLEPAAAISRLAAATGEEFRLVRRLAGGETGAHEVAGPDDRRYVAKWDLDPSSQRSRLRAVELTRRLRDPAGWPVPRQRVVEDDGCLFVLQDFVTGEPIERLSPQLAGRLLDLHPRRLDLGRATDADDPPWPAHLLETLTVGGSGYCLHEPLRHDDRTAGLLARIEAMGSELDPTALTAHDIVHWDFHPGNLLQVDGELSAVVDNDFATVGDAAFDLVTLALTSLTVPCDDGVRALVFAAAFDGLDPTRRAAYVGHLLIRFLDWSVRKGRDDEVDQWLGQADRLLGG
ncbi:MAG: phosphotransferase family protein [Acidimicrobiia bacterium]